MAFDLTLNIQVTAYGSAANSTVNKPTSTATGDLILFCLYIDDSSPTVTIQSGFTEIARISRSGGDTLHLYAAYRIAQAGDGATYSPWSLSASALREVKSYRVTGHEATPTLDPASAVTNQGTGTTLTFSSITTGNANTARFGFSGNYSGGAQAPSGGSDLVERSDGGQIWLGSVVQAAAGASGAKTNTCPDNDWLTIHFGFQEAGGAAATLPQRPVIVRQAVKRASSW